MELKQLTSKEVLPIKTKLLPIGATAKLSYELRNIKPDENVIQQIEGLFAKALVEKELDDVEGISSKAEENVTNWDEND